MSKQKVEKSENNGGRHRLHRDNLNFVLGEHIKDKEKNSGISLTTPGMAEDLPTMIERLVKGRAVPIQQDPYFHGDLPDLDRMDQAELEMYRREVYMKISDAEKTIKDAQRRKTEIIMEQQQKQIELLKKNQQKTPEGAPSGAPSES